MKRFVIEKNDYKNVTMGKKTVQIIKKEKYDSFNEDILGLGKIQSKSVQTCALSVIFDLEGFTNFCKQIDPHLAVPEYLSEFLKWLFVEIRTQLIQKEYKLGYTTWANLPFLSKYLGDGVLFLWDTQNMSETEITNIVVSMYEVCVNYKEKFLKIITKDIITPPKKLRCGIARGLVYSIGGGNDYVGPCINMSARLQKLYSCSFCFSRRGINPTKMGKSYQSFFTIKQVNIRGIGDGELVCFLKEEYDKMLINEKSLFIDV